MMVSGWDLVAAGGAGFCVGVAIVWGMLRAYHDHDNIHLHVEMEPHSLCGTRLIAREAGAALQAARSRAVHLQATGELSQAQAATEFADELEMSMRQQGLY